MIIDYNEWKSNNEEQIIMKYQNYLNNNKELIPEETFEGILDDEHPETAQQYIENIKLTSIPDYWVLNLYNDYTEGVRE